jgi:hypothetical protein
MGRESHGAPRILGQTSPKQIATTLTCSLAVSPALAAGLPLSKWNTIDDNTGKVKSEVQLYDGGSKLYGKSQLLYQLS